jgi:hypothetical protein
MIFGIIFIFSGKAFSKLFQNTAAEMLPAPGPVHPNPAPAAAARARAPTGQPDRVEEELRRRRALRRCGWHQWLPHVAANPAP